MCRGSKLSVPNEEGERLFEQFKECLLRDLLCCGSCAVQCILSFSLDTLQYHEGGKTRRGKKRTEERRKIREWWRLTRGSVTGGREGGEKFKDRKGEKQKSGTRRKTRSQELQVEGGEMEKWGMWSNSVSGLDLRLDN